jgi:hypothetical protein
MMAVDLEQIIGQAAAHARNDEWGQAHLALQLAQLVLLAKIAGDAAVPEMITKYWTVFAASAWRGGQPALGVV